MFTRIYCLSFSVFILFIYSFVYPCCFDIEHFKTLYSFSTNNPFVWCFSLQVKANCYAQSAQIRKIRRKMVEVMTAEASKVQLRELVKKLIPESIGKEIEKQAQVIFPLKDVLIRKVKILKKPKFDITKLMELHGDGGDDTGMEMMRPEADDAVNTLTADVTAAAADE